MTDASTAPVRDVQARTRLIAAARRMLAGSPDQDISARAVCDAAGIGRSVMYRLFGDKNGLLSAVVDDGFNRYIERERSLERSEDPVADLQAGWDDHMAFAAANPALYRLMFSPVLRTMPPSAGRIFVLLTEALDRCTVVGALRIPSRQAAQMVLSANIGVALTILSQPDRYCDPRLSERVRDAVLGTCLTLQAEDDSNAYGRAVLTLIVHLNDTDDGTLEPEERALLLKQLHRLATN